MGSQVDAQHHDPKEERPDEHHVASSRRAAEPPEAAATLLEALHILGAEVAATKEEPTNTALLLVVDVMRSSCTAAD